MIWVLREVFETNEQVERDKKNLLETVPGDFETPKQIGHKVLYNYMAG